MALFKCHFQVLLFFGEAVLKLNYTVVGVFIFGVLAEIAKAYELELFARLGLSQALLNQSIFNLNK